MIAEHGNLITGGSGFLGRHLCCALLRTKQALLNVDIKEHDSVPTKIVDLAASQVDFSGMSFRAVYHLAALAHPERHNYLDNDHIERINVTGTVNLLRSLETLDRKPEKFIFTSSVSVYGCEEGQGIMESEPCRPNTCYGRSKLRAEEEIICWAEKHEINVTIFRLPLVVGRDSPGTFGRMVRSLATGRYLGVGSGSARRSMVLARDVALLISEMETKNGIYHLTDGHHPSFFELEEVLCRILSRSKPFRVPEWCLKCLAVLVEKSPSWIAARAPFDMSTIRKMTTTLTFSDRKACQELDWSPARILDSADELI